MTSPLNSGPGVCPAMGNSRDILTAETLSQPPTPQAILNRALPLGTIIDTPSSFPPHEHLTIILIPNLHTNWRGPPGRDLRRRPYPQPRSQEATPWQPQAIRGMVNPQKGTPSIQRLRRHRPVPCSRPEGNRVYSLPL